MHNIFWTRRRTNLKVGKQMEYKDPSPASAMSSKVKGQGRKVKWWIWQVLADKSRTKPFRNTEIGKKLSIPRAIMRDCFKVKGQGHQAD